MTGQIFNYKFYQRVKVIFIALLLLSVQGYSGSDASLEEPLKIIRKSEVYFELKKRIENLKFMIDDKQKNYVVINAYEDHETHIVRLETLKVQNGKVFILLSDEEGNEKWKKVEQKK